MAIGQRGDGLQQLPVLEADQVTLSPGAASDKQGNRQRRVVDDVMAALVDPGAEHLGAIQAIAHGKVIAVDIVTGTQEQRAAALFGQRPATQGNGTQQ